MAFSIGSSAVDVKINFMFSLGVQGWSETYYCVSSDLTAAYNKAFTFGQTQRCPCLAAPSQFNFIRVAEVGGTRRSTLTAVGPDGSGAMIPNPNFQTEADQPQDAYLLILYASSVSKQRPLYLHGFPDGAYNRQNPNAQDAQTFFAATKNLKKALTDGTWSIRYHPTKNNANPQTILEIVPSAAEVTTVITTQQALGVVVGDYIEVYGSAGLNPRIGVQRVLSVDNLGTGVTIGYTLPSGYTYTGGAQAVKYLPALANLDDSGDRGFTSHKVGRPFGAARGARRKVHP